MSKELIESYRRKLRRAEIRCKAKEAEHKGNEIEYTYHGGFDLGYLKGRIAILEDVIDDLQEQ